MMPVTRHGDGSELTAALRNGSMFDLDIFLLRELLLPTHSSCSIDDLFGTLLAIVIKPRVSKIQQWQHLNPPFALLPTEILRIAWFLRHLRVARCIFLKSGLHLPRILVLRLTKFPFCVF